MLTSFVEYIVKSLVDKPDLVTITQTSEGKKVVIGVKVGEEDLGRVIGKDGQTIRAIRSLALAVSPAGSDISVDIIK
jgi:predicted RNA-binding protein YlqC (UPF0109 family)